MMNQTQIASLIVGECRCALAAIRSGHLDIAAECLRVAEHKHIALLGYAPGELAEATTITVLDLFTDTKIALIRAQRAGKAA